MVYANSFYPNVALEKVSDVLGHHLHTHGQQDDAEELAGEHHAAFAQQLLDFARTLDNGKHPQHVDGQTDKDVHVVIHRLQ